MLVDRAITVQLERSRSVPPAGMGRLGHQPPQEGEMYTNNRDHAGRRDGSPLADITRRRRLENLLYTRKRVAQLAAEHRSHCVEDAVDLYLLQLEVEQVIADEFPTVFDRDLDRWLEEDSSAEHHPAVRIDGCSMCEAIANHLDNPTAA